MLGDLYFLFDPLNLLIEQMEADFVASGVTGGLICKFLLIETWFFAIISPNLDDPVIRLMTWFSLTHNSSKGPLNSLWCNFLENLAEFIHNQLLRW